MCSAATDLKTGMAAVFQQRLHQVVEPLVHRDVESRLTPLVARVWVGARLDQLYHDGGLIAVGCVVHRPVAVLVLQTIYTNIRTRAYARII